MKSKENQPINYNPITEGNIKVEIIKFAIPFLIAFLIQGLYGAVDLIFIGHYASSNAISGVSVGGQVLHSISSILIGVALGCNVLIGNRYGAKDNEGTAKAIGASFVLFSIFALILTPLTYFLTDTLIRLLQTPPEAIQDARTYVKTCIIGIPFIIIFHTTSFVFRGLGDSKRPLHFFTVSCLLNIILDYFFIAKLELSTFGAALATVISQAICSLAFLYFFLCYKKNFSFQLQRKHFRLYGFEVKQILKVGIPASAQDSVVHLSFLVIHAIVNTLGVTASASVGIIEKLLMFGFIAPVSFSAAVATITAQNMGAKQEKRAFSSLCYGVLYALTAGVAMFSCAQMYPEKVVSLFTNDPRVIQGASSYLLTFSYDFILVSFIFCVDNYFIGRGNSLFPLIHSILASILVRIPASYYFSLQPDVTLHQLGMAAPLASIFSVLACCIFLYLICKKKND